MSNGGSAVKAVLGATAAATGAAAILLSAPKLWAGFAQFRKQLQRVQEVRGWAAIADRVPDGRRGSRAGAVQGACMP